MLSPYAHTFLACSDHMLSLNYPPSRRPWAFQSRGFAAFSPFNLLSEVETTEDTEDTEEPEGNNLAPAPFLAAGSVAQIISFPCSLCLPWFPTPESGFNALPGAGGARE